MSSDFDMVPYGGRPVTPPEPVRRAPVRHVLYVYIADQYFAHDPYHKDRLAITAIHDGLVCVNGRQLSHDDDVSMLLRAGDTVQFEKDGRYRITTIN